MTFKSSLFFCACLLTSQIAQSAQPSKIAVQVDRYPVAAEGRWDLLSFDARHHHLFISRATHVQVFDTDSKMVIGDIPDTEGVHGIAVAEELNRGYTSNGKSNSITVFDLTTLRVLANLKITGMNPDVILYEPKSGHLFTFNGHSSSATVIDAVSLKEIATIVLPGKPELAVSNDAGEIFVNIEDKNEIAVIDSATNKVLKYFSLGSGVEPTGLAIDKQHNRLFSVCANRKIIILNSETGSVMAELPIGSGPDSAAFDPELGIALSSNEEGTLTLIKESDPDHFSVLRDVATPKGARTMAYDADHHRAFLVTGSFDETSTATQAKHRPAMIPGSFVVLKISLKNVSGDVSR